MRRKAWIFRSRRGWAVDCDVCQRAGRNVITGGDWHLRLVLDWDDAMAIAEDHVAAHRMREKAEALVSAWTKTAEVLVGTAVQPVGQMAASCAIDLQQAIDDTP